MKRHTAILSVFALAIASAVAAAVYVPSPGLSEAQEGQQAPFGATNQAAGSDVNQKCPNMSQVGQEPGPANYWPNGYPGASF